MDALAPGGAFAFQVPANFGEPSHVLLQELATSDRWGDRLRHLVRPTPVLEPAAYLRALLATGVSADVWETTYLHVLRGANPVLEWVQGTALRPYLSALGADESDEFGAAYAAVLRAVYPVDAQGRTVFPFRRIFAVRGRRRRPGLSAMCPVCQHQARQHRGQPGRPRQQWTEKSSSPNGTC